MIEYILLRLILLDLWAYHRGHKLLSAICWKLIDFIYRYRCPYPVIDDPSVRACIASGNCGCDNNPRKRP